MNPDLRELAARAQRSWEPVWSGFLDGGSLSAGQADLALLSDLSVESWGGFAGAERRRLVLMNSALNLDLRALGEADLVGLELLGNFLFDPAEAEDFRTALHKLGLPAESLGDIWLRGDRGAQAVALKPAVEPFDGQQLSVRSVSTLLQVRPLEALQPPPPRQPKRFSSVEASLRLDAVGSAGFGLSRSRMVDLIRNGAVRLNWEPATSPSKELRCGDRIQLRSRGELVLSHAELTKKNRWRVELIRQ